MANPLVSLADVKTRLGFDFSYDDAALTLIINEAQDHVLKYIDPVAPPYTDETVPARIRSAIILVVARLYTGRGEDGEVLSPSIKSLLRRDRKPVVA